MVEGARGARVYSNEIVCVYNFPYTNAHTSLYTIKEPRDFVVFFRSGAMNRTA